MRCRRKKIGKSCLWTPGYYSPFYLFFFFMIAFKLLNVRAYKFMDARVFLLEYFKCPKPHNSSLSLVFPKGRVDNFWNQEIDQLKHCKTPSVQVRMARQDLQDHETTCWAFQETPTLPSSESCQHKTASSAELSSAGVVRIVSSTRQNYFATMLPNLHKLFNHVCKFASICKCDNLQTFV